MDMILAPDVFVNASVAPGTAADQVVQRVLGKHKGESQTSDWVMDRVSAILSSVPDFKAGAVQPQIELIGSLLGKRHKIAEFDAASWSEALVATATAAGAVRVVTDHPDLLEKEREGGIDFISTETWLLESTTPPPTPVT